MSSYLQKKAFFSPCFRARVQEPEELHNVVMAVVTVKASGGGSLVTNPFGLTSSPSHFLRDRLLPGAALHLELVGAEIDPSSAKKTIPGSARRKSRAGDEVKYESFFDVPADFGEVGAVRVQNQLHREVYIKTIDLHFPDPKPCVVSLTCDSWVQPKHVDQKKRVFFTSKSYLPSQTPSGLKSLRETELQNLRGNGEGERKGSDRVYDYDTYNDLGNPESPRPVLGGGAEHPYPRRCRTGRPHSDKDPLSEQRSGSSVCVPRDEAFAEVKQRTFNVKNLKAGLRTLSSQLNPTLSFPSFKDIYSMYIATGVLMPKPQSSGLLSIVQQFVKAILDYKDKLFLFDPPEILARDSVSWLRDEEFSRQTLAGINPFSIQLVKDWPLKSELDPKIYGPCESLITTELVEKEIRGYCVTVDEAMERKKLFMLDYHDLLMPYVNKVREIKGTTLYGSRTLFFLTEDGTLKPVAIELTRPPVGDKPQWKQVFTCSSNVSECWLWRIAKAHVRAHDAGYHQLVIHWLRTHCCTEPYIIAANRQLSAMHPIYRLLHPHFRYTMKINALARESLINADGIIETTFSPAKYSMELSSAAYDRTWRFDMEALPADLIRRGMAVEDPTAEHGLKLTIEDYPFANDGLILWDATKEWVRDYVNHYYPDPSLVENDQEIQAWWTEVRTKGHADKKEEPWWPVLKTPEDLTQVLTTIIWVASGHHAAVNFGQYMYAGYFPNQPTIARTNMPTEDPSEESLQSFLKRPETALLECFPSKMQATKVMAVLDVLSSHSPDEEYIGEVISMSWAEDPVIKAAFVRFNGNLKKLEGIIDERNSNENLENRFGAGVVPYELMKPFSKPGVTGMGVPNSISI